MRTVAATQIKSNFKYYADLTEQGEAIRIRRPKSKKNVVLINEEEYNLYQRALIYYSLLKENQEDLTSGSDSPETEIKMHGLNPSERKEQYKLLLKTNFKHKTLKQRYEEFKETPVKLKEYDWGERVGREIW